jgi:hypothetical protein
MSIVRAAGIRMPGIICLLMLVFSISAAKAASISYGNFAVPGAMFLDVTESSGTDDVPLYGAPDPFVIGLDFDPASFVASSVGGGPDVTDGQLNFTIMTGLGVNSVNLFEAGDFTLAGTGTPATQVFAGAILRATVTQINGVNVVPINLFPSNASVGFNLVANPGIVQPWSLGTAINVAAQLAPNQRATKVEVAINNQLLAFSEPTSVAFIAKKEFVIDIDVEIPEPATITLAGLAVFGLVAACGRRRSA